MLQVLTYNRENFKINIKPPWLFRVTSSMNEKSGSKKKQVSTRNFRAHLDLWNSRVGLSHDKPIVLWRISCPKIYYWNIFYNTDIKTFATEYWVIKPSTLIISVLILISLVLQWKSTLNATIRNDLR